MLSKQTNCLISIPNPQNQRVLHPGKVLDLDGTKAVIQLEEAIELQPGAEVTLFAEWRNKFHQQGATVLSIKSSEAFPMIEVNRIGEPTNCENRELYRVSVASQGVLMSVGKQINCLLCDISAEGMAVLSQQPLQIGTSVDVNLKIDGLHAIGSLRVQTEKKLASGQVRYGLLAAERKTPLRKSLEAMSIMMQRRQLRRLAGAA